MNAENNYAWGIVVICLLTIPAFFFTVNNRSDEHHNSIPVFGVRAAENGGNGVKVTEVIVGLPGQKSGFEIDDVILEINGVRIACEQDYSDAIDHTDKIAQMKVLCGKTGQSVDVEVVLRPRQ